MSKKFVIKECDCDTKIAVADKCGPCAAEETLGLSTAPEPTGNEMLCSSCDMSQECHKYQTPEYDFKWLCDDCGTYFEENLNYEPVFESKYKMRNINTIDEILQINGDENGVTCPDCGVKEEECDTPFTEYDNSDGTEDYLCVDCEQQRNSDNLRTESYDDFESRDFSLTCDYCDVKDNGYNHRVREYTDNWDGNTEKICDDCVRGMTDITLNEDDDSDQSDEEMLLDLNKKLPVKESVNDINEFDKFMDHILIKEHTSPTIKTTQKPMRRRYGQDRLLTGVIYGKK